MWTEEKVEEIIELTEDNMFEMMDEVLKVTKKFYTEMIVLCSAAAFILGIITAIFIHMIL